MDTRRRHHSAWYTGVKADHRSSTYWSRMRESSTDWSLFAERRRRIFTSPPGVHVGAPPNVRFAVAHVVLTRAVAPPTRLTSPPAASVIEMSRRVIAVSADVERYSTDSGAALQRANVDGSETRRTMS